MISTSKIIALLISLCASVVLPIVVLIVYGVKNKGKGVWSAWFLGAAGFFLLQMVIRTPIIKLVSANPGVTEFAAGHFVLYALIMAFTAALSEVIARYAVAKIMNKKLTVQRGIAAGLGHGGIEAIIIGGVACINNLAYILMINGGTFDAMVEKTAALGVDTSTLLTIQDSLLHTNWMIFLLVGYERILTMILQLMLSFLMCYFVSRKQDIKGILICLLCHTLVDFTAPLINSRISATAAYVIVYTFLTIIAVVSAVVICRIKKKWDGEL